MSPKVRELLERARLLPRHVGRLTHDAALTADGDCVSPCDPRAVTFTDEGALARSKKYVVPFFGPKDERELAKVMRGKTIEEALHG